MKVFVKSKNGNWLMPTPPPKARHLLKEGKAKVIKRTPFTIQLTYDTAEHVQPIVVGIDDGGKTVGIAAVTGDQVLYQEEVTLRDDIKSLLDTRRSYRRGRRNKLRYRPARFLNRKVKKGWIPPSIKSKKDAIVNAIKKLPLPSPTIIRLEDCYFDLQAMENPNITGKEYQEGAHLKIPYEGAHGAMQDTLVLKNCFFKMLGLKYGVGDERDFWDSEYFTNFLKNYG